MNIDNLQILEVEDPPTNNQEIESAEKSINRVLPNVYKQFLLLTNGAIMNNCVLYSIDRVVSVDDIYNMKKYAPQYICIGNNNGDYELVMEAKEEAVTCSFIDSGSIGVTKPRKWFNFEKWIDKGCPINLE